MIRLIATDMDGTFLDSNKKFDKSFIELFYKMQEKKIKFVIASGNQYYRLYQKFLPLSDQMYFIAENGSHFKSKSPGNDTYLITVSTYFYDFVWEKRSIYFKR